MRETMKRRSLCWMTISLGALFLTGADWLGFRGSDGTSVSDETNLPVTWTDSENLDWKADLPGRGLSCPIIVGDRVFVTCNSGADQQRLHVLCFDAISGRKLWERQFWATGRTMSHPKTSMAAASPTSDGKRVFAFFGSCDLVCLDFEGNLLWLRGLAQDYPLVSNNIGMASSPVVSGETVVLQIENDRDSFAAGIDTVTGETRWRIERERTTTYTTPLVLRGDTPAEDVLVLQSGSGLAAHEPATGRRLWTYDERCSGIPSLTADGGALFVPSRGLTALRPGATGETPEVLWQSNRLRPGTASPVAYQGRVYALNGAGVLTCADAATGDRLWALRLKGPFSATPVVADGRLYCANEEGLVQVVELEGDEGKIVGTSKLDEMILATPSVAHGALYFRSDAHLWKIAHTEGR